MASANNATGSKNVRNRIKKKKLMEGEMPELQSRNWVSSPYEAAHLQRVNADPEGGGETRLI